MIESRASGGGEAEAASLVAIEALGYLAALPDVFARFLKDTGAAPGDLAAVAETRTFQAQVLGFLANDDSLLLAFASHAGHAPDAVMRAYDELAGTRDVV
ncbi:MAG: DUF3572 family protein [Pseudomonadota bacterium]